ncbi:hypothetical protein [Sinorhizobium fredii]|uniref:hypothetical protein n=1 Tax=Rhizobium fredii TaxID=380 RepID=UPI001297AD9C|nr:hypothetical protein [Sinorhizobium fredii]MQW99600.1 hypothetical protein [Sinorhizobium fredii]
MSRLTLPPEKIVELLPHPIVDLISELSGSDDPGDQETLAKVLRKCALEANASLYARGKLRLVAQLPADALPEYQDDDIEQP